MNYLKNPKRFLVAVLGFLLASPAFAQVGGLTKFATFFDSVNTILHFVAGSALITAIIWAGYKLLFSDGARKDELFKILIVGVIIASASEIVAFFFI